MAKRCPSCGYGPIGPFIDNCPICAEPVRNVRSGGRGKQGVFVVLNGGDETAKVKIECFFDYVGHPEEGRLLRLKPGQTITVRGEYDGQVSNVQLRECVLVK